MQFIDEARIYLKAGKGGDGCISFRREKYIDMGGPDGGNGGAGGSIIFEVDSSINTLLQFRYNQHFKAEDGKSGGSANKTGKSGKLLLIKVPVGTQIFSVDGLLLYDLIEAGQNIKVLQGGTGGIGNSHFKSSINQAPYKRTTGKIGEELEIYLKLSLLSDVGLVGLPNAGKSTLLSVVTAAKPKIGDYQFTTLSPMLGIVNISEEEFVLADLPGLIEGAHAGHGLGDKFLKHVERCSVLIHLIDCTADDVVQDYEIIRNELACYSKTVEEKVGLICLNKCDALLEEQTQEKVAQLQSLSPQKIFVISSHTKEGVKSLLQFILTLVKENKESEEKPIRIINY